MMNDPHPVAGKPVRVILENLTLKDEWRYGFRVVDSVGNIFDFSNEQARYELVDGVK